jgi:hypothetical protein
MGFWDLFKGKGPSHDAIIKQVRKAKEHYAQPDYRRMAMDQLLKWNTKESLRGILERFSVVVQSPHWDEEEKKWLCEQIIALGASMKPILRDFILEKNELSYPLKAYRQISNNDDEYSALLLEALKKRPPHDHRSIQGKQEILAAINEINTKGAFDDIIAPYLHDHSDDVQYLCVEALAHSNAPHIHKLLVDLISSDAHSARVIRAASGAVSRLKIKLDPTVILPEAVSEDYVITQGLLTRR